MSSFFKKPHWARSRDDDPDPEFYRRADQTYKDIIATTKNVRQRSPKYVDTNPCKRPRFSDKLSPRDTEEKKGRNECQVMDDKDSLELLTPSFTISRGNIGYNPLPSQKVLPPDNSISAVKKHRTPPGQRSLSDAATISSCARSHSLDSMKTIKPEKGDVFMIHSPPEATRCNEVSASDITESQARGNIVVQILITSKIRDTKPLIVYRKMSQPLKDVRLAWCNRQNLPKELHTSIFLTWKGRRLYDVTTCRSLHIDAHGIRGSLFQRYEYSDEKTDGIRIHMEAVTDDLSLIGSQPSLSNDPDPSAAPIQVLGMSQHAYHSIVLKSPGLDEFKMKVKLEMQVLQVVAAFRNARNITAEYDVYLVFDGERLDGRSCLNDYEITDGDLIDVSMQKKDEQNHAF